jgi:hypothetical protein
MFAKWTNASARDASAGVAAATIASASAVRRAP